MSTVNQNLTDNQQEILRAMVDVNLKPAATLAAEAGINRGSMISAIGGYRPMPAEKLRNLLRTLNLDDKWELSISVAHYLRVGADIEPLKRVIDVIFESAVMYFIQSPDQKPELEHPWTGLFLFEFINKAGKGLVLVHRDRFRSGKGVVNINPEGALPILPTVFKNVVWADNPMIELDEVLIKQLEYAFYNRLEGPTLRRLREILNLSPVCTWADVRDAAEHFKVSTEEILKFIESKKRKI